MATFGEGVDFASIMLCMTSFSCLLLEKSSILQVKRRCAESDTCKIHPPLQRLPWIHQIVHFIQIKLDNLNQSSGQSDEK